MPSRSVGLAVVVLLLGGCASTVVGSSAAPPPPPPRPDPRPAEAAPSNDGPLERLTAIYLDLWQAQQGFRQQMNSGELGGEEQQLALLREALSTAETALPLLDQLDAEEHASDPNLFFRRGLQRDREFAQRLEEGGTEAVTDASVGLSLDFEVWSNLEYLASTLANALGALAEARGAQCLTGRLSLFEALSREHDQLEGWHNNGCRLSGVLPPAQRLEVLRGQVTQLRADTDCLRGFAQRLRGPGPRSSPPDRPACVEEALQASIEYAELRDGNEPELERVLEVFQAATTPSALGAATSQLATLVEARTRETELAVVETGDFIEVSNRVLNGAELALGRLLVDPAALGLVRDLLPDLDEAGLSDEELLGLLGRAEERCPRAP